MSDHLSASKSLDREPLALLWRFFAAPPLLLALMALLAGALVLSTLLPQIPRDAAGDPEAWLALQSGLLGRGNGVLHALGLFDIVHAFWFRLLLVLAGIALFVWAFESADLAWRATRRRWTGTGFCAWQTSPLHARLPATRTLPQAEADVRNALERQGYRPADVPDQPFPSLIAARRGPLLWAQPVAFAALLAALAGLAVSANWGWQSPEWSPAVGEVRAIRQGTPYSVRLDAFEPGASGRPSQVTWLKGEQALRRDLVGDGHPGRLDGLAVRQIGTVPAVTVRGTDGAGNALLFRSGEQASAPVKEIGVSFQADEAEHVILIPAQKLFLLLSYEGPAAGRQQAVHVALLREAEAAEQPVGTLYDSGELRFNGFRIGVELTRRPILRVDYRPAMGLVVVGLAVALAALAAGWLFRPRLVWVSAVPGQECPVLVRVLAAGGAGDRPWFAGLTAALREALARGA